MSRTTTQSSKTVTTKIPISHETKFKKNQIMYIHSLQSIIIYLSFSFDKTDGSDQLR